MAILFESQIKNDWRNTFFLNLLLELNGFYSTTHPVTAFANLL